MISYQEALQTILAQAAAQQKETLPLLSALKHVSVTDITSPMHVPSFRNSAMDGFAVRRADIANATMEHPVTLPALNAIAAGDLPGAAGDGAAQIMTGAPVPETYDAVIPVENVSHQGKNVTFTRPAREHENIRFPGEDIALGQRVLSRGDRITPEHIMLLAALGIPEIETWKLPQIHILSTGKEVTDNAGKPLPEGRIYNSNAPYLMARSQEEGFAAHYGGIIADDASLFERSISAIPAGSVIVTTGAVSKGAWDFIPESMKRLGAKTHFHRVNIRPGKPLLFATLPGGNWFFGLPGNPISAAVGFRFFVLPLMRALQSLLPEQPIMARLENSFTKKGDFRQFLKATLKANSNGELLVNISSGQESFKISPLAESNAWTILEEERTEYEAGERVAVLPFGAFTNDAITHTAKEPVLCKTA